MKLKTSRLSELFCDRAFLAVIASVALPIMIQNTIGNFVNLLDNLMVGQLGTEDISAVAIVNQLVFIYNLCIFGALSGAGIYTAQYYGSKNDEGIRSTFRYKLMCAALLTLIAALILLFGGRTLIGVYLKGEADGSNPALVLQSGMAYLKIVLWGMPAFMLTQVYSITLKECGETLSPMRASLLAVFVNLALNYILIYGHLGFPALGVRGAALATTLARYVELGYILIWLKRNPEKAPYLKNVYSTLRVPLKDAKNYTLKGVPLLLNEALWSSGMAVLNAIYSVRSLSVVAALNICTTICSLFNVVFLTLGTSVTIIVGQLLGAGELKKAKLADDRLIAFSVVVGLTVGLLAILTAPYFPLLYKVSDESRHMATQFIRVQGSFMIQHAYLQAVYFTLRTGGKTMMTFFFDSGFTWVVLIPVAALVAKFTSLSAVMILLCVQCSEFIKTAIGIKLIRSDSWLVNMVSPP